MIISPVILNSRLKLHETSATEMLVVKLLLLISLLSFQSFSHVIVIQMVKGSDSGHILSTYSSDRINFLAACNTKTQMPGLTFVSVPPTPQMDSGITAVQTLVHKVEDSGWTEFLMIPEISLVIM